MGKFDSFINSVEKIGTTQPISDENGQLTMPPARPSMIKPNPVSTDESVEEPKHEKISLGEYKIEPSEKYKAFFENIDATIDSGATSDPAKIKVKEVLTEAVDVLSDDNLQYWTNDKSLVEACRKIKNVLSKIRDKI